MATRKKSVPQNKRTPSQPEKRAAGADSLSSGHPVSQPQGPCIGVIGWNSPRFAEANAAFLEVLKKMISSVGGRGLFLGVSGGSDTAVLAAPANGKAKGAIKLPAGDPRAADDHGFPGASNYGLPSRDIVADQIEMILHEERLDGLVLVPWSVNSLVGMLMAAARCGAPALFAPNYRAWPALAAREPSPEGKKPDEAGCPYSRFSMPILLEVMGLAKIGTFEQIFKTGKKPLKTPAAPLEKEGEDFDREGAEWAGKRILEMVRQKIQPRRFFTEAAIHNAVCADIALGGSAETALHLGAVAREAGVPLPLKLFNESAQRVVQLVQVDRNGDFCLSELERNGGMGALLGVLHGHLQHNPTVMGKNIAELAKDHASSRSPFRPGGAAKKASGFTVLFGNLAQEGALFRTAGLKEPWLSGSGPARVFNREEACLEALRGGKIKKGDVLVVRYCGPRGTPGMPPLNALARALQESGLEEQVLVLTDGRAALPGRTPAIVHASPEAAVGSALSIVDNGDLILWNASEKTLSVRLTEIEVRVRLSRWREQEKNMRNSFLCRYAKYSSSSASGAILA